MMINWRDQKVYVIGWEPNAPKCCELCGQPNDQLRPYGPEGKYICLQCGCKNPFETDEKMAETISPCDFVFRPNIPGIESAPEEYILALLNACEKHFGKELEDYRSQLSVTEIIN